MKIKKSTTRSTEVFLPFLTGHCGEEKLDACEPNSNLAPVCEDNRFFSSMECAKRLGYKNAMELQLHVMCQNMALDDLRNRNGEFDLYLLMTKCRHGERKL